MEVLIERLDYFGRGICYVDDKICFVFNALPDEIVDIKITKSKKSYLEASVIKYIKTSKDRLVAPCPYYNVCGGCQLQHISIEKENEYKTQKVKDLVERLGNVDASLVEKCISVNEYNYRNKVTIHAQNKKIGLYSDNSHDVVDIDKCLLLRSELNERIGPLKKIIKEENSLYTYIKEIMLRVGNDNHDVVVSINNNLNSELFKSLNYKGLYSSSELVNGEELISEIGDCKYYVSPYSFFQVNSTMVKVLYDLVLDYCMKNKMRSVLDLYCGTGSIGIYIAKYVKEVLGIDISESSIIDACKNTNLNHINNARFICSSVEDYIDKIVGNYDLVIVDPPRAGIDKKTIDYLKKINSKTIIYISCDPATFSRDLNLLGDNYQVKLIQPLNMFPKTYHVECFSVLERK